MKYSNGILFNTVLYGFLLSVLFDDIREQEWIFAGISLALALATSQRLYWRLMED